MILDWLWSADTGLMLGALGFVSGIASLIYSRSQARGTHAQLRSARVQAEEALRAAELVADGARQQALEALKAAGLVAEAARQQALEALKAAGLVAESAREQAIEALRASPKARGSRPHRRS
jgi:formate dehydrogenase maturation protein FdhE